MGTYGILVYEIKLGDEKLDYMEILEATIEASNDRDATLKAAEKKLKNFQKMLYNVNG